MGSSIITDTATHRYFKSPYDKKMKTSTKVIKGMQSAVRASLKYLKLK